MKIWITRLTTGELHAGGLERCRVWFQEPRWVQSLSPEELREFPFGSNHDREGCGETGWHSGYNHKYPSENISFGKMFGYGGETSHAGHIEGIAEHVWDKLNEHYGNTKFPIGWYEYEKSGKCRQEDFLLEIELSIKAELQN